MTNNIVFRGFEPRDHLTSYLQETITARVNEFLGPDGFDITVRVDTPRNRTSTRKPMFHCEAIINSRRLRRPIVVRRKNSSFYKAVNDAAGVVKKVLRRRSGKRVALRNTTPEIQLAA